MQGESNQSSAGNDIGLGSDSQLAADGSFVDSSQADMFIELLKTRDQADEGNAELAGVEAAVETIRTTLNELMATLVRKRSKTGLVSVGMFESTWLEPSPEQQSCARIDSTQGEPIGFIGMQNKVFRTLTQAMMGAAAGGEETDSGPLANSEKQLLAVVADRLLGKLYTSDDPIESIAMPAPAKICQPEDVLDLADRGHELVLVRFEVRPGTLVLPVEMLFPMEILETAMAEDGAAGSRHGNRSQATDSDAPDPHAGATAKLAIDDVPVAVNCELFSAEFPLSDVNQLSPGQVLGEGGLMGDVSILDAEMRPFLSGALQVENGRLRMVARRAIKNTNDGAAR